MPDQHRHLCRPHDGNDPHKAGSQQQWSDFNERLRPLDRIPETFLADGLKQCTAAGLGGEPLYCRPESNSAVTLDEALNNLNPKASEQLRKKFVVTATADQAKLAVGTIKDQIDSLNSNLCFFKATRFTRCSCAIWHLHANRIRAVTGNRTTGDTQTNSGITSPQSINTCGRPVGS